VHQISPAAWARKVLNKDWNFPVRVAKPAPVANIDTLQISLHKFVYTKETKVARERGRQERQVISMEQRSMNQASVASLSALETNKVLKNTYLLLSATLGFSALMAGLAMAMNVPAGAYLICLIASMVLGMFVLPRTANSAAGLGVIFLVTGLLGFGLGPVISIYLTMANGAQLVSTALGGTAVIFLGLAGYAMASKRDFSFMGGFVAIGMMVMVVGMIANIFLQIPIMAVVISAGIILLMSAMILMQIGSIVNGGETNYIMATYSLYLSIFNIFISLLQLLGIFGGDD
jgi:modulator of FtsH protease